MTRMIHRLITLILLAATVGATSLGAEELSYTVSLDPSALAPADCGGYSAPTSALPIVLGEFTDRQADRRVAQLEKGDTVSPVFLKTDVGDTVKEGIALSLTRCGYRMASPTDKQQVSLSATVQAFRVDWQKKLVTAKGSGMLSATLVLDASDSSHYSFNFQVETDEKGMRKKGVTQVEKQLGEAYRAFLLQVIGYQEFHQAMEKIAKKAASGEFEGGSSYPLDEGE